MLKLDRFSCSQKIQLKRNPPVHLYSMFVAYFLQTLTQPFGKRNNHIRLLVVLLPELLIPLLLLFWTGAVVLIFILLRAHGGYMHLTRSMCRCSSSSCKTWGLEQMALALWCRVLGHCILMIWCGGCPNANTSQWGVLAVYDCAETDIMHRVNRISKKGMEPTGLESSPVNCIHWSMELICSRKLHLYADLMTTKVSSTYLFHREGAWADVLRAFNSKSSIYWFVTMGLMGEPMATPSSCIMCYDVKVLFKSVSIEFARNIIKKDLEEDKELQPKNIHDSQPHHLSAGVLHENTYFPFQGKHYEQLEGVGRY